MLITLLPEPLSSCNLFLYPLVRTPGMDYKFCTMTHFFSNVSIYVLLCFLLSIPLSNALVQASRRFHLTCSQPVFYTALTNTVRPCHSTTLLFKILSWPTPESSGLRSGALTPQAWAGASTRTQGTVIWLPFGFFFFFTLKKLYQDLIYGLTSVTTGSMSDRPVTVSMEEASWAESRISTAENFL